ncbi:hypothetical protein MP228_010247 [Amoeboaphelidium protococcarum]|nr:hypothetical protein MP228_010247 [Amoeboaphelidium protococcarum]
MKSDQQRIWYLLVQANGVPYNNSTAASVLMSPNSIISDLGKVITAENANALASADLSRLKVYKNMAQLDGQPLDEEMLVGDLGDYGKRKEDALFVLVPVSRAHKRSLSDSIIAPAAKKWKLENLSEGLLQYVNAKLINRCIVSDNDAYLPYPQDKIFKLFVRKCYVDVFDLLMENVAVGREHFGISGTPGIGKSQFFLYILYRVMNDSPWKPKRIVYQVNQQFFCYDLRKHYVVALEPLQSSMLIHEQDTLYVIDGLYAVPLSSSCVTLFISSPLSDHFREYVMQKKATVWYLPVWTLEELSACRQECYSRFPQDTLLERFHMYGGVARSVFYDFKVGVRYFREDPLEMQMALADVDAVRSLREFISLSRTSDITHTLLHMAVGESQGSPYKFRHVDLASKYVGEQLWDLRYAKMVTSLREMFGCSCSYFSKICSRLFKMYGHRVFSKGGMKLKCRNLEDGSEFELQLDSLTGWRTSIDYNNFLTRLLDTYHELSDNDDQLSAVDSFSKQGMFQFTVGAEHPIRSFKMLQRLCGLYASPKLYFVVPPHRFAQFQKQKFIEEHGGQQVEAIPGLIQYVLELEVQ